MQTSTRYILRQLIWVTFFVAAALTLAVWLSQSLRFMDYIVNRGLPVGTFLQLMVLLLPQFLGVVLPIAGFVAILFVYNKLLNESELVVMRAAGLSQLQLARPALLLALGVTLLVYAISLYFLPLSFRTFKDLQFNIRNNYSTVLLQEGVFNTIGDDLTVYVRERTGEGELRGILVHDARDDDQPVTMMADRGAIVQSDQGPRVVLVDGNRQVVNPDQGRLQMLYFDRYTIDIDQLQTTVYSRRRSAEERYLSELLWPEDGASGAEFRAELAAEGHRRLSYPLYTLTFAMIGLAAILSGEFSRRGQIKRVLAAVAAVGGMQALQLTVSDLAMRSTTLIPAMYASVILGTGIAAWLLLYRPRRRRAAPAGRLSTEAAS